MNLRFDIQLSTFFFSKPAAESQLARAPRSATLSFLPLLFLSFFTFTVTCQAQDAPLPKAPPEETQPVISRKSSMLPNYSGTWKINHGLSQSPSPVFDKTEVSLVVTQDEKQLVVEQKLRLNGHDQPSQPLEYPLDATSREMPVSRPVAGKAKLTMRWIAKEGRMELRSVIEMPLLNEKGEKTDNARLVTHEYRELLEQGKLLKVVRIKEWPESTETSRLIFERQ